MAESYRLKQQFRINKYKMSRKNISLNKDLTDKSHLSHLRE